MCVYVCACVCFDQIVLMLRRQKYSHFNLSVWWRTLARHTGMKCAVIHLCCGIRRELTINLSGFSDGSTKGYGGDKQYTEGIFCEKEADKQTREEMEL